MDRGKLPVLGGREGGGERSSFALALSSFLLRSDDDSPSSAPVPEATPMTGHFGQTASLDVRGFSDDLSGMPDYPPRNVGHRRAQSEFLILPQNVSFDGDLGMMGSGVGPPLLYEENEDDLFHMFIDKEKLSSSLAASPPPSSPQGAENTLAGFNERPRISHQHSHSMGASISFKSKIPASSSEGPSLAEAKKAFSATKLADLALIDPKRAKRFTLSIKDFF